MSENARMSNAWIYLEIQWNSLSFIREHSRMKRIIAALLLLPAALLSQEFTGYSNDAIEVTAIGPAMQEDGLYWTITYHTKADNIDRLTFADVSDNGNQSVLSLTGKEIYATNTHMSAKMEPSQYQWVYETGQTHRLFAVTATIKGKATVLYAPLRFTEPAKQSFRMLLKMRTGHDQPTVDVFPYHYLDGRKWIARNSGEDQNQRLIEYTLADEKITSWTELFTQSILLRAIEPERFLEIIQSNLAKDCDSLKFEKTQIGEGRYFYEWRHSGCGGYPAQHEIAVVNSVPEGVVNVRYTFKGPQMPKKNYEIWKSLLTGNSR